MAEKPTDGTPAARLPSLKRPRGTPTFETPHRSRKRAFLLEIAAQEGEEECRECNYIMHSHAHSHVLMTRVQPPLGDNYAQGSIFQDSGIMTLRRHKLLNIQ